MGLSKGSNKVNINFFIAGVFIRVSYFYIESLLLTIIRGASIKAFITIVVFLVLDLLIILSYIFYYCSIVSFLRLLRGVYIIAIIIIKYIITKLIRI